MDWSGFATVVAVVAGLAGLVWLIRASRSGEVASLERQRDEAQQRAEAEYLESEYQRRAAKEQDDASKRVDRHRVGPVDVDRIVRLLSGNDGEQDRPT